MSSLNKVMLVGRIGKDPETKFLESGTQMSKFSLATTENYKKNDQWEKKTEWHNIVVWGKTSEYVGENFHKGDLVYVEGKITTRSWDDSATNSKKYITEINANQVKSFIKNEEQNQGSDNTQSNEQEADGDLPF